MLNDVKHCRYVRPAPSSELWGFFLAFIGMLVVVGLMAWVDYIIFGHSISGTY